MKPTLFLSLLSISLASAFPSFVHIQNRTPTLLPPAERHPIDVHGEHAFVPPSAGDLRGPCPALNALANHNYITHSGLMTLAESMEVSNTVWGFGEEITLIATTLGEVYGSGDGVHISIGGPDLSVPVDLFGSLIDGQGLSGTHNQFEGDSSPVRGDFFTFHGNNYDVHEPYFKSLLESLARNKSDIRYHQSVATNPYFFYGPVPMVITTLVHMFITGIMANFPPSHPDGYFTPEALHSLFGFVADDSGELQYRPGHERIPENWYRRPKDFTHLEAAPQIEALGAADRRTLLPGGNMGEVNTFTPMDLAALTGGVYTEETLFEGTNLRCFCFQVLQLAMPSQVTGPAIFLAGGLHRERAEGVGVSQAGEAE
ncbi:Chloroperoxidase [Mycena vulgaris]|nr:Chloroperoxidase [Mycena vulgaris]